MDVRGPLGGVVEMWDYFVWGCLEGAEGLDRCKGCCEGERGDEELRCGGCYISQS